MSKTKTQKIIKVGNSYAVTIDKKFVDATNLKPGSKVTTTYNFSQKPQMVLKLEDRAVSTSSGNLKKDLANKISPALEEWTSSFIKNNKKALEELA